MQPANGVGDEAGEQSDHANQKGAQPQVVLRWARSLTRHSDGFARRSLAANNAGPMIDWSQGHLRAW
jgi:hypothetical protein